MKEKHQPRPSSELSRSLNTEENLRKQTKLTVRKVLKQTIMIYVLHVFWKKWPTPQPEQMEQLKLLLDEELNYSKKKSRNNMKKLMQVQLFTLFCEREHTIYLFIYLFIYFFI